MKVYLSTSKAGSLLDVSLVEKRLGELDVEVVKWNPTHDKNYNYYKLRECKVFLAIPPNEPTDRDADTYRVGKGQFCEFEHFIDNVGGNTLIASGFNSRGIIVNNIKDIDNIQENWQTDWGEFWVESPMDILDVTGFNMKKKVKNSVHVTTQEEWDFVTEKLGYNWNSDYFKEAYDAKKYCILIKGGAYSRKLRYNDGDYYSFEEWCSLNNYTFKNVINPCKEIPMCDLGTTHGNTKPTPMLACSMLM